MTFFWKCLTTFIIVPISMTLAGCSVEDAPSITTEAEYVAVAPTELPETAPPTQPSTGPVTQLLEVYIHGGDCPNAACTYTTTIYTDGSYVMLEGASGQRRDGVLDATDLAALVQQINQANFPLIRSRPFTDECPLFYDGQEYIYTFYTTAGVEVIASCEYLVDQPVFQAVNGLLAKLN